MVAQTPLNVTSNTHCLSSCRLIFVKYCVTEWYRKLWSVEFHKLYSSATSADLGKITSRDEITVLQNIPLEITITETCQDVRVLCWDSNQVGLSPLNMPVVLRLRQTAYFASCLITACRNLSPVSATHCNTHWFLMSMNPCIVIQIRK